MYHKAIVVVLYLPRHLLLLDGLGSRGSPHNWSTSEKGLALVGGKCGTGTLGRGNKVGQNSGEPSCNLQTS